VPQTTALPSTHSTDPAEPTQTAEHDPGPRPEPRPAVDPTTLDVVPWIDQVLLHQGHDPRSDYVERFWLPILGPSTTWLLRRVARGFDDMPSGFRINLADTARALGLGEGTGRNAMITRSIDRACQFGMAQRHGYDRLSVRTHLPPLTRRQLTRLPLAVRNAHDRWMDEHRPPTAGRIVVPPPPLRVDPT
jgi:hypothetical protein